jgi:hypothetical protein
MGSSLNVMRRCRGVACEPKGQRNPKSASANAAGSGRIFLHLRSGKPGVFDVPAIAPNDHLPVPVQGDHPMTKWDRNEIYPQLLVSVVLAQVDSPLEGARKGTAHEGVLNGR